VLSKGGDHGGDTARLVVIDSGFGAAHRPGMTIDG
jgi:hypothetical protein